jgi:hypothetical protein
MNNLISITITTNQRKSITRDYPTILVLKSIKYELKFHINWSWTTYI